MLKGAMFWGYPVHVEVKLTRSSPERRGSRNQLWIQGLHSRILTTWYIPSNLGVHLLFSLKAQGKTGSHCGAPRKGFQSGCGGHQKQWSCSATWKPTEDLTMATLRLNNPSKCSSPQMQVHGPKICLWLFELVLCAARIAEVGQHPTAGSPQQ